MVNIIPKENKDWHENLARQTSKNFRYHEEDVINPDQKALEAYLDLYDYLEDRGRLIEKKKGKAARRGKQETVGDYNKGAYRDNMKRLDTLLDEALQGRWPTGMNDPSTEYRMFNQNKNKLKNNGNVY